MNKSLYGGNHLTNRNKSSNIFVKECRKQLGARGQLKGHSSFFAIVEEKNRFEFLEALDVLCNRFLCYCVRNANEEVFGPLRHRLLEAKRLLVIRFNSETALT
jgi:hypothetical protein